MRIEKMKDFEQPAVGGSIIGDRRRQKKEGAEHGTRGFPATMVWQRVNRADGGFFCGQLASRWGTDSAIYMKATGVEGAGIEIA